MKLLYISLAISLLLLQVWTFSTHHQKSHTIAPKKTLPKLSSIVLDSNANGLVEFNSFLNSIQPYNLTQGETRAFFRLCDQDRDDRISPEEWENCVGLFVTPYENSCLSAKDSYLLAEADLKKCLTLEVFQVVPAESSAKEKATTVLIEALNRDDAKKINFMDYIFLRRASFAWKECSVDDRLNKRRMECAISATTPQKRKFLPVSNQVFDIAVQIYKNKIKEHEAFLDIFSFIKIAYIYYYFNEFELPFQEEYISKKALIRGIEDQILPTSVSVEFAHKIYFALDPENNGNRLRLNFAGYASVNHLYRQFRKYAEKGKKLNFTISSFEKFLKEPEWNHFNNVILEGFNIIDEKEFMNLLGGKNNSSEKFNNLDDRDYFTRLKQQKEDNKKLELLFKIFDTHRKNGWNYTILVKFTKLSWAFQAIDMDDDGKINSDDINLYLRNKQSLIPYTGNELKTFEVITEFIRNEQINVKQFCDFFNFRERFDQVAIPNSGHAVTLANLKLCMTDLGLVISNQTKKFAKEFFALSKLPAYNYEKAFKRAIKEEILVSKIAFLASGDKQDKNSKGDSNKNAKNYRKFFENEMRNDQTWT